MNFYYKILKDNCIIDVNNKVYAYQPKPGRIIEVSNNPQLISLSTGGQFFTSSWLHQLSKQIPGVEYIESELISEEEYNELRAQLDKGIQPIIEEEPVIEEPQETEEPTEEKHEKVFSLLEVQELLSQMTAHINKLEAELNELKK